MKYLGWDTHLSVHNWKIDKRVFSLTQLEHEGLCRGDYHPLTGWAVVAPSMNVMTVKVDNSSPYDQVKNWNYGDWNVGPDAMTRYCGHDWRDYIGLTERYHYCDECDEKKPWEAK